MVKTVNINKYNVRELCKLELVRKIEHILIRNDSITHLGSKIRKLKKIPPQVLRAWLVKNCVGYYDGKQPGGIIAGWIIYRGVKYSVDDMFHN